jgi:hypothetical protein
LSARVSVEERDVLREERARREEREGREGRKERV